MDWNRRLHAARVRHLPWHGTRTRAYVYDHERKTLMQTVRYADTIDFTKKAVLVKLICRNLHCPRVNASVWGVCEDQEALDVFMAAWRNENFWCTACGLKIDYVLKTIGRWTDSLTLEENVGTEDEPNGMAKVVWARDEEGKVWVEASSQHPGYSGGECEAFYCPETGEFLPWLMKADSDRYVCYCGTKAPAHIYSCRHHPAEQEIGA